MKMAKNKQKKAKKVYVINCEIVPLTPDVTCSKLQGYRESISDKKLSVEHTPKSHVKFGKIIKLHFYCNYNLL